MMETIVALGGFRGRLLASAALLVAAGPALAADLSGGSMKDAPSAADSWTATGYVQATNDYIFRGMSQTRRDPAIQGGADISYGWFYAGTFLSNVDFKPEVTGNHDAKAEFDVYLGIKPKVGDVTLDLGLITYNYYWNKAYSYDPTYQELKVGASKTVLKDLTLGATFYWSPSYTGEVGQAITVEGTFSKPITTISGIDIAASGAIGYVSFADHSISSNVDYTYGNLGLTGTYKAVSLDLRWWDSNYPTSIYSKDGVFQADSAFAATLKYSF
jgi:uncharacterized protein (TIGR02001 family)